HGEELWKSDGTSAGTVLVADINPGAGHSIPSGFAPVGGTVLFSADDGVHGVELWRTDGTAAGTTLVSNLAADDVANASSDPAQLAAANDTLFFTADDGTHGVEVWTSPGPGGGAALPKDISPGAAGSSAGGFTYVNGSMLFSADDGTHGPELWKSDGTAAGTALMSDIVPALRGAPPSGPTR